MRYTQLDRIESLDPGKAGVGVKLSTRGADSYGYTPYRSALSHGYPWSLVLESAFQLGAIVIDPAIGPKRRSFLASVDRAVMASPVPFGLRLDFALQVRGLGESLAKCRCRVEGERALLGSVDFSLGLTDVRSESLASSMEVYSDYLTRAWRDDASLASEVHSDVEVPS